MLVGSMCLLASASHSIVTPDSRATSSDAFPEVCGVFSLADPDV